MMIMVDVDVDVDIVMFDPGFFFASPTKGHLWRAVKA